MADVSMELMHGILVGMRTEMRASFVDLKHRISQLEGGMGLMLHYAGDRAQIDANFNQQLDTLKQRVTELEHRLEQAG